MRPYFQPNFKKRMKLKKFTPILSTMNTLWQKLKTREDLPRTSAYWWLARVELFVFLYDFKKEEGYPEF